MREITWWFIAIMVVFGVMYLMAIIGGASEIIKLKTKIWYKIGAFYCLFCRLSFEIFAGVMAYLYCSLWVFGIYLLWQIITPLLKLDRGSETDK